jgi:methionine-rich copper-binding protein CopC
MRSHPTRRAVILGLAVVPGAARHAAAQVPQVLATLPLHGSTIQERPFEVAIRFAAPVDHRRVRLAILRGAEVMEQLQPRPGSMPPEVFANARALPPGDYAVRWEVMGSAGATEGAGSVPFLVR